MVMVAKFQARFFAYFSRGAQFIGNVFKVVNSFYKIPVKVRNYDGFHSGDMRGIYISFQLIGLPGSKKMVELKVPAWCTHAIAFQQVAECFGIKSPKPIFFI